MARGSDFECITMLQISWEQGYVSDGKFVDLRTKLTDLPKMLSGLKRSVNR
jgi:four helix bundle protein